MNKLLFISILWFPMIHAQVDTSNIAGNEEIVERDKDFPQHSIDLGITFWNNAHSSVSTGFQGLSVNVNDNGKLGSLVYSYYPNEDIAAFVKAGVMETKVKVENLLSYTSTIIPVAVGAKYFLLKSVSRQQVRPYVSGAAGLLFGIESSVKVLSIQHHVESVIGISADFGAEILFENLIKLNISLGYNLFGDFNGEIGSRKNFSGPEFSLGTGLIF